MQAELQTITNVRAASHLTETEWNYEYICDIIPSSRLYYNTNIALDRLSTWFGWVGRERESLPAHPLKSHRQLAPDYHLPLSCQSLVQSCDSQIWNQEAGLVRYD